MRIADLRQNYHQYLCAYLIRLSTEGDKSFPNFADKSNKRSVSIALGIADRIGCGEIQREKLHANTLGRLFEDGTKDFLETAFAEFAHIRPGEFTFEVSGNISKFHQYRHLSHLAKLLLDDKQLQAALGADSDYLVKPDIVVWRSPLSDEKLNEMGEVVSLEDNAVTHSPLRAVNQSNPVPLLHASVSCKWTLRSDRGQNARTEALNLIRNRKGHTPKIVVVTAEPLPTRLASLALGTGDLDCVYHIALTELKQTLVKLKLEDQLDMLNIMLEGERLRDISDLPLDLTI